MSTIKDQKAGPKHILVVDDDTSFLSSLGTCLKDKGYQVTTVDAGRKAAHLIGVTDFDLIVTDIRMPEVSGIELLHFVKRTKKCPVILMTGYAELSDNSEASTLGAASFLQKPFMTSDLLDAIKQVLLESDAVATESLDENFSKVNIDDFISGKEIKYDIFIRLGENRYVKIAHAGEDLAVDRIRAYKGKNIRFLYMQKTDFRKYVGFNLALSKAVAGSRTLDKGKKLSFLKHTSEIVLQNMLQGVDEEGLECGRTVLDTTLGVVSDHDDLMQLLMLLNSQSDHVYSHSVGVALYAGMIARQMKWTSPTNLFKVSMGGLLHDVGKKELPVDMLRKTRRDLTTEELKLFETHANRGLEILQEVRSIPGDILQIIYQHHEGCLGDGYPLGLKKSKIHPMARVVRVADDFCELALKGPAGPPLPPDDSIRRMATVNPGAYDSDPLSALSALFKFPLESVLPPQKHRGV